MGEGFQRMLVTMLLVPERLALTARLALAAKPMRLASSDRHPSPLLSALPVRSLLVIVHLMFGRWLTGKFYGTLQLSNHKDKP